MTKFQITTLDLPALHRRAIGFDRMFQELNRTFANSRVDDNYPPHNVVRIDEHKYALELAVAGFAESEIDVELEKNVLTVRGEKVKPEVAPEYLHKGISSKTFVREFPLGEHIQVIDAQVQNGILTIALEEVIPEEQQPKKIAITFNK